MCVCVRVCVCVYVCVCVCVCVCLSLCVVGVSVRCVQKLSKVKLYLPKEKCTMNGIVIFFKSSSDTKSLYKKKIKIR